MTAAADGTAARFEIRVASSDPKALAGCFAIAARSSQRDSAPGDAADAPGPPACEPPPPVTGPPSGAVIGDLRVTTPLPPVPYPMLRRTVE
jgi:hypothetical protein